MNHKSVTAVLLLGGVFSVFLSCLLGSTHMPMHRVLLALIGQGEIADQLVVWSIRLPRALNGYAVGFALAMSGAALQGLLRNPLAEPGVLGVSATASLAATIAIYYGFATINPWILPLAAAGGAIVATILLTYAAIKTQSAVTLILIGVGVSSLAGALMSLLLNLAPNPFSLSDLVKWNLGSVANRSFADLLFVSPLLIGGCLLLFIFRRGLSALTLGEAAAVGVGLNIQNLRLIVVVGAGLATGASVALAGAIGFVGIVAPHIIRPLVHYDPARSLLPAALFGGCLLVLADIGVRVLPTSSELALGVVAALFGAPIFVWIAMQRRALYE